MRIALSAMVLIGLFFGLFVMRSETARSVADVKEKQSTTYSLGAGGGHLAIFKRLETLRIELAKQRSWVESYHAWAPEEAQRCLRVASELDQLATKIESWCLRYKDDDSLPPECIEDLERQKALAADFDILCEEFRQAAKRK
jgi:hypothetical protein